MKDLLAKGETNKSKNTLETRATQCRRMELLLSRSKALGGGMVVVTAIPFDCIGRTLSEDDLPSLRSLASQDATGAAMLAAGMVRETKYILGSQTMWIDRATGTTMAQPKQPQIIETTCGMLKKAFACWSAVTSDDAALKEVEQSAVTLDDEAAPALVPASAIAQLKEAAPAKRTPNPAKQSDAAPSPQLATPLPNPSKAQASPDSARNESRAAASSGVFTSDLGFTYGYPGNWVVLDPKLIQSAPNSAGDPKANAPPRKAECSQTLLGLRYSSPRPVLVMVTAEPFDCAGRTMSESDLIMYVSAGSQTGNDYDLSGAVYGSIRLAATMCRSYAGRGRRRTIRNSLDRRRSPVPC